MTAIASATPTFANIEGSPTGFFYQTITPVTLLANTTYYLAEDVLGGTFVAVLGYRVTINPLIIC